jgi:hypothetical protein
MKTTMHRINIVDWKTGKPLPKPFDHFDLPHETCERLDRIAKARRMTFKELLEEMLPRIMKKETALARRNA